MVERKLPLTGIDTLQLLGFNDVNLQLIEDKFEATVSVRGDHLLLRGNEPEVAKLERIFTELIYILNKNGNLAANDVETVIDLVSVNGGGPEPVALVPAEDADSVVLYTKVGLIRARTAGQRHYLHQARKNDIVFVIGPAGTGKTYLAVAMAVAALKSRDITKIILARPAVEAGESLGFLPGDLREKVDPYLRPLYDALDDMLSAEKLRSYMEKRIIEIVPLAYMRGRTLHNAFVILDEAQNATAIQMKMFLTRLGTNSRAIITGDITQIDLPSTSTSGLVQIQEVLKEIQGIQFVYLDRNDVVRHRLVKEIIDAYDRYLTPTDAPAASNASKPQKMP